MQSLAEAWDNLAAGVARAPALAVATDFDGTLAPIQDRPQDVEMSRAAREALKHLAGARRTTVAVVSGRALSDIEKRLDLTGALVIGNHGFEIRMPWGAKRTNYRAADVDAVRAAARAVERRVASRPGVFLEEKGPIVAVHVRRAAPPDAAAAREAVEEAAARQVDAVRVVFGKDVLEIRPAGGRIDKGTVLLACWAEMGVPAGAMRWFFGDDVTDEDAFRALPAETVTVRVGGPGGDTSARYGVASPEEVVEAMEQLAALRRG